MTDTVPLRLVAVYRMCRVCGNWLDVSEFTGAMKIKSGHVQRACRSCLRSRRAPFSHRRVLARSLIITQSGRDLLKQIREEEQQSGVA